VVTITPSTPWQWRLSQYTSSQNLLCTGQMTGWGGGGDGTIA